VSTIIAPGPGNGPWHILALSRDPDDPVWLLAAVALSEDIRPATLDAAGRYTDWREACAWTAQRLGQAAELTPARDALVWFIRPRRETGRPR
jgi:hypothetical protein